jgi:tRNA A37 N6-isopentenylltransferase MiaA
MTAESSYLALVGPTCVGKTAYSHALVAEFPFELVNVDSFQVYNFFRLGTGRADLQTDRAHLYGFQDPNVVLPADKYLDLVAGAIANVGTKGRIPLFEGGSISYLKALMGQYRLQVVGLRPRDVVHARQLIEQRMTTGSEELLLAEIAAGLKRGYENTIILQDDVVYLPYVRYLEGEVSLPETRQRVRENLLRRYETQMKEYETLPVEWFEPSAPSLVAVRNVAERFLAAIRPA